MTNVDHPVVTYDDLMEFVTAFHKIFPAAYGYTNPQTANENIKEYVLFRSRDESFKNRQAVVTIRYVYEKKPRIERNADCIVYDMAFVPGEDNNGIPHNESVEWLWQWTPQASVEKIYLIEGGESPIRIWESDENHYQAKCRLLWEDPEEATEEDY